MRNFNNDDPRTQTGFVFLNQYVRRLEVIEPIVAGHAIRPSRAQLEKAYGADRIARDFGERGK